MKTTPIGLAGATVWPAGKEVRHVDPHYVCTGERDTRPVPLARGAGGPVGVRGWRGT
jgi:hypothetical protein